MKLKPLFLGLVVSALAMSQPALAQDSDAEIAKYRAAL